jgi:hypothetical protein
MRNVIPAKHTLARSVWCAVLLTGACFPFKKDAPYPKRQVTAKDGISVLISNDARCLVPTKEFSKVVVGMMYSCNWHDSSAATTTMTPRPAARRN